MDSQSTLHASAIAAIESGRLDLARPLWSELCELDPSNSDNWIILSTIDEKLGFLPAAQDHLRYAMILTPDDPDVWMQSGHLKWQLLNIEDALNDFSHCLALDFSNKDARIHFANRLMECHRFDDALIHFAYVAATQGQLTDEEIIRFACCSICAKDASGFKRLLSLWDAAEIDTFLERVVDALLQLFSPNELVIMDLSCSDSSVDNEISKSIQHHLNNRSATWDWHAFFDRRAQLANYIASAAENEAMAVIAKDIAARACVKENVLTHVVDIGCGTGRLARELAKHEAALTLTGIDHSTESIRVANAGCGYDTLLCEDIRADISRRVISTADVIVLSGVLGFDRPVRDILDDLIDIVQPGCVFYIAEKKNAGYIDEIKVYIDQLCGSNNRYQLTLGATDQNIWIVSSTPLDEPAPSDNDKNPVHESERLANQLIQAGQLLKTQNYSHCKDLTLEVAQAYPGSSEAMFNLGLHAQSLQQFDQALHFYRRSLAYHRGNALTWFQIGAVYQQCGRSEKLVVHAYVKCLKYMPGYPAALQNLIGLYSRQSNAESTWKVMHQLMMLNPLGIDHLLSAFKQQISIKPDDPISQHLIKFLDSEEWFRAQFEHALEKKFLQRAERLLESLRTTGANAEDLLFIEARLREKSGDMTAAIDSVQKAIRINPENSIYWTYLASISASRGKLDTAHRLWRYATSRIEAKNPNWSNRLFFSNYNQRLRPEQNFMLHQQWGNAVSASLIDVCRSHNLTRRNKSKIRIGYVSADFKMHSVAMFFYNVLKFRNSDRFEVYCYSATGGSDVMTTKLRLFSDYWREIKHIDDATVEKQIRHDGIDILVDLSGHTGGGRLPLFARKPAPIQCTYLGYANTTGLGEIDYRITDTEADPPGVSDSLHSEQLIRLPNGFLGYSRHAVAVPITLNNNTQNHRHYTFACCNNINKVNDDVIACWSGILRQLPESTLLIKAHNLNNREIVERYQNKFSKQGIEPQRIHLMNTIDNAEHLNLYNQIDIALDPFPYNGTTTTCDALWMGVPVLALAGDRHAARVGASILTRLGLNDWIARDTTDYIDKAIKFAQQPEHLIDLKLTMRQRMKNSSLMQPGRIAKELEDAYSTMWDRYVREIEYVAPLNTIATPS